MNLINMNTCSALNQTAETFAGELRMNGCPMAAST